LKTFAFFVFLGTLAFFLAASGLGASLFAPGFAPYAPVGAGVLWAATKPFALAAATATSRITVALIIALFSE